MTNMLRRGSVLRLDPSRYPTWGNAVVVEVSGSGVKAKRPFSIPGKSFIEFEELTLPLPLPKSITIED